MSSYELDSYGNELYPLAIVKTADGKKHTIEEAPNPIRYAKQKDGMPYYPLGIDGHEYRLEGILAETPIDYPISNDGFYIIPLDQKNNLITIPSSNILFFTLPSDNFIEVFPAQKAHKTTIKSARKPRTLRKKYSELFWVSIVSFIYIFLLGLGMIFRKLFT